MALVFAGDVPIRDRHARSIAQVAEQQPDVRRTVGARVAERSGPIDRPEWFPQGAELEEWAALVAHPRENADKLAAMGGATVATVERLTTGERKATY